MLYTKGQGKELHVRAITKWPCTFRYKNIDNKPSDLRHQTTARITTDALQRYVAIRDRRRTSHERETSASELNYPQSWTGGACISILKHLSSIHDNALVLTGWLVECSYRCQVPVAAWEWAENDGTYCRQQSFHEDLWCNSPQKWGQRDKNHPDAPTYSSSLDFLTPTAGLRTTRWD
jgi:hypothetical protein